MTDQGGITRRVLLRDGGALTVALLAASGPLGGVAVAVTPGKRRLPDRVRAAHAARTRGRLHPRPADRRRSRRRRRRLRRGDRRPARGVRRQSAAHLRRRAVLRPCRLAGQPLRSTSSALDKYEARGWRLRIEGSRGNPKLEWGGPVTGWQAVYRDGLAALEEATDGRRYGDLSPVERDLILQNAGDDGPIGDLVDIAWPHTYQFMYGAPEYGGNREPDRLELHALRGRRPSARVHARPDRGARSRGSRRPEPRGARAARAAPPPRRPRRLTRGRAQHRQQPRPLAARAPRRASGPGQLDRNNLEDLLGRVTRSSSAPVPRAASPRGSSRARAGR